MSAAEHPCNGRAAKVYRFALYGRPSSGKTCYLAALAMDHGAHPDGLTCEWVKKTREYPRPAGEWTTWDSSDPSATFHLGTRWLEESIEKLKQGDVPAGTDPNQIYRFMYDFTTPEHVTYRVELIDYSGELVRPDITGNKLAELLLQHFSTTDGVLVLAEVPHPERDAEPLAEQLHLLKQAFALLRGEMQDGPAIAAPVALLLNKWDRRLGQAGTDASAREAEVQPFLDGRPQPAHRSLVDTLRNSVTEGNFKAFPVSAFGTHELATLADPKGKLRQVERPRRINPLPSFGLEDPFVWAVGRRDLIDLEQFADKASRLG
jgi:hypothetical protein